MTTDIPEFDMFQIVPDALIGIQVRRIAWEPLQPKPCGSASSQEVLDGLTAMNGGAVPDNEQLALDGGLQVLEKGDDGSTVISFGLHCQVEFSCRCDGANHRVMITGELAAQQRCFAHWCPGTDNPWQQIECRFVNEENRAPFRYGSFLALARLPPPTAQWQLHRVGWHAPWDAADSSPVGAEMDRCNRDDTGRQTVGQ